MSRNIVFCADGTWSGPGEPDDDGTPQTTNVFKLFENLGAADTLDTAQSEKERERTLTDADGSVLQIAKYLHGVGDSKNFLSRLLGGSIGSGLIARIVRGYTFLSRNYAAGDRIFIIGFSRGAYTVRALAGLVAAKGLLDPTKLDLTDKERAYRLGSAVWYEHRRDRLQGNTDWLGELEEAVLDLPAFFTRPPPADQRVAVSIEAVAVWDTVGALGIPEYNAQQMRVDTFRFADLRLSPMVSRGFHAVAVDEIRQDFTPTLWDADPRITQVLFAGAHSDVGGGYPKTNNESGLSDGSLTWMTARLAQLGVKFLAPPAYLAGPDAKGPAHRPWIHPPWNLLLRGPRAFPLGLDLFQGVVDRIGDGDVPMEGQSPAPYRPSNLAAYVTGKVAAAGVTVVAL
jgi:uncharacterized protein (DUF2235 family)